MALQPWARNRLAFRRAPTNLLAQEPEEPFRPLGAFGLGAPPQAPVAAIRPDSNPTAPGTALRVSTTVPSAMRQGFDPHESAEHEIGLEAARNAPEAWAKNAQWIKDNMKHIPIGNRSGPDLTHERLIGHLHDNLVWLHNKMAESEQWGPERMARAAKWYEGANRIAHAWAERFGVPPQAVAGVMAALSPQKDWFQNVSLAERLLDMHRKGHNLPMTPEVWRKLEEYAAAPKKEHYRNFLQQQLEEMRGKGALGQLTKPFHRAMFMRAYDEAHNNRNYRIVTPEGELGDVARTLEGEPQRATWGSLVEIHKAMQALQDPTVQNVSRWLGEAHKVRNFYNNIIAPLFGRDVTIDTHAIAAAHLMPLGGSHKLVEFGLGGIGSSSNRTGAQGGYGVHAEAYRRAAKTLGLSPRQLQSVTWEGVRGLFTDVQKRDKKLAAAIEQVWRDHGKGKISANDARDLVFGLAKGFEPPEWA